MKLSTIFAGIAILITNVMCVVVTNICTNYYHAAKNHLTSFPWEVGLFYILPCAIGIIACSVISYVAKRRGK